MDKHSGNNLNEQNDQLAQVEVPGTTITQTRPIEGYHREQGKTICENNQNDTSQSFSETPKMTAKERLLHHAVQSHMESQIHAHTQNQTILPS